MVFIDSQQDCRCLFVGGDLFGHIPVLMKKFSLITMRKREMIDSLISVRVESAYQAVGKDNVHLDAAALFQVVSFVAGGERSFAKKHGLFFKY